MSENIKLTSGYTVFVIYDDKSHYKSIHLKRVMEKQSYERIYISGKLGEIKKRCDLLLMTTNRT